MSEKQDIIFEWLEADAETLQKLFPEDICMELQEVTSYIYAAEDRLEGRLIGAAAFSILEMLQRIVQLHYLVVEEAFQGQAAVADERKGAYHTEHRGVPVSTLSAALQRGEAGC